MEKLRLATQIVYSNFRRLSRPYKLLLALTYRCNSRCLTCSIWKRKPTSELTLEEIQTLFAKNSHFSWVNLTGGEIFLCEDLPEILETILTECNGLCLLNFTTNGLQPKRTERILAEMPRHAVARTIVTVSVDGPPELDDRIHGVKGSFKKGVETFRRLRALERKDLSVYFGFTLFNLNASRLQETYQALRCEIPSLRYQHMHVNVAHNSPYYYNKEKKGLASVPRILQDIEGHYAKQPLVPHSAVQFLEKRYLQHLLRYLKTKKSPMRCHALSASCFINPQAVVYPCINYDRALGSLRDVDFDLDAIWSKQETRTVQQEIRRGKCPHCWTPCEAYQSIMGGLLR